MVPGLWTARLRGQAPLVRARPHDVAVFDDFAHHPTAVATTLEGVRERHPDQRIFALFEPRRDDCRKVSSSPIPKPSMPPTGSGSPPMRAAELPESDEVLEDLVAGLRLRGVEAEFAQTPRRSSRGGPERAPGDLVVVMSNGAFGGIHERLIEAINAR